MGAILTSHGSEVIKLLGLGSAISETSTCFDLLRQYVCDVQKTLADKQEQLQERLKHTTQLQVRFLLAYYQHKVMRCMCSHLKIFLQFKLLETWFRKFVLMCLQCYVSAAVTFLQVLTPQTFRCLAFITVTNTHTCLL